MLYAIPVERFLALPQAQGANAAFLGVVALWRVALYAVFLRRAAGLSALRTIVATLLPLVLIVGAQRMQGGWPRRKSASWSLQGR